MRILARAGAAIVAAVALAQPALAETLFLVHADAADPIGHGEAYRFTPADGQFSSFANDDGGVVIQLLGPDHYWTFEMTPPEGQSLAPGTYDGLRATRSPTAATLQVIGEHYGCQTADGHVVIHEMTKDAGGDVVDFAADFERRCDGETAILRGAVRYHAGDAACSGAADGTACEDLDACTATSACTAGTCTGTLSVSCEAAPDACHGASLCHPGSGACLPPGVTARGTPCEDGDACTTRDYCEGGRCRQSDFDPLVYCGDEDACTDDYCDPARGCVHAPLAGTCGRPGTPSTFLFVHRDNPDYAVTPHRVMARPPDNPLFINHNAFDGSVSVDSFGSDSFKSWKAFFAPPAGTRLVPGVYEGTSAEAFTRPAGVPGLEVERPGNTCGGHGRFVVHEAEYGAARQVVRLAIDFEQDCGSPGSRLHGAVRYHAGDAACAGAADGLPCDDRNACTGTSSCQDGTCVGLDPLRCGGDDVCQLGTLCDPTTGTCGVSQPAHVGESCASADSCVSSGVCQEGYCVPPLFPGCFDGNVCTEDVCRNGGCGHTTAIGSCWALKGVVGFTATFRGKSCSCQQRYRGTLLLREDGTFAMPGGVSRCRSETIATPEETGTWHASRTRLALVTDNLSAIASAEARCTGVDVRIKGYRTWVKPVDGGTRLKGAHRHRQVTPRLGLTIATTARFSGKPGTGEPIPGGNGCVRQIVDCLND